MTEAADFSSPALRSPWISLGRQKAAVEIGMWIFIASEVLFFGGLFAAYGVYRYWRADGFLAGARETDIVYGTVNSVILLTSSLTIAVAQRAARWRTFRRTAILCLWATATFGLLFLVVKGFEYSDDLTKHLFPGPAFPIVTEGAEIFFAFYWVMTALHAVHMIVGIALVTRLAAAASRVPEWFAETPAVTVVALYWGLVDVIWTIVFVLLYLPGRTT